MSLSGPSVSMPLAICVGVVEVIGVSGFEAKVGRSNLKSFLLDILEVDFYKFESDQIVRNSLFPLIFEII